MSQEEAKGRQGWNNRCNIRQRSAKYVCGKEGEGGNKLSFGIAGINKLAINYPPSRLHYHHHSVSTTTTTITTTTHAYIHHYHHHHQH